MTTKHLLSMLGRIIAAVTLTVAPTPYNTVGQQSETLADLIRVGKDNAILRADSNDDREQELFARTFAAWPNLAVMQQPWHDIDMVLRPLSNGNVWVLYETASQRCGRGVYAFRPASSVPLVMEAPHRFHDLHTGTITRKLFLEGNFMAACWNTVNRKQIDVAHTADHTITAFTLAAADSVANVTILQMHGFSPKKRNSKTARDADLILSDGTDFPQRWVRQTTILFQSELPFASTRLFPFSISELGATTNAQGAALRNAGRNCFLHLEMSPKLRKQLRGDEQARQLLLEIITRANLAMSKS